MAVNGRITLFTAIALFFLFKVPSGYSQISIHLSPRSLAPGDVVVVEVSCPEIPESICLEFNKKRTVWPNNGNSRLVRGIIGIDLSQKPGAYALGVFCDAVFYETPVYVREYDFGTRNLTLPPSMTHYDEETSSRIERERERVNALWAQSISRRLWDYPFIRPVPGGISGPFGRRTLINGEPRSPHSGLDLRAKKNENVLSANTGKVVLADDLFFSGKSVFIDHGLGLFSMYFHLEKILVEQGEMIKRGQLLGHAGSTGRSSGPHLHWGIRLQGARVDPLKLIEASERLLTNQHP